MNYRTIHGIHAGQQSPILQLFFSSEENHNSDIQLRDFFRNLGFFSGSLLEFNETSPRF